MEAPNIENAVNIRSDDVYTIRDMPIYDKNQKIVATASTTILNGGQATRGHVHKDTDEFYFFLEGMGTMYLGTTETWRVRENSVIFVPRGVWHRVENRNDFAELIFYTFYPGASDRPGF